VSRVIGSVFSSVFGPEIHAVLEPFRIHGLTVADISVAQGSMWATRRTVAHFPRSLQSSVGHEATAAFMNGLHRSSIVAAGVALAAAVAVFFYLPSRRATKDPSPIPGA